MIVSRARAKSARTAQIGCRAKSRRDRGKVAFNDMPGGEDRRSRTDQRGASLSSTQQHRNCTHDRQILTEDAHQRLKGLRCSARCSAANSSYDATSSIPQAGPTELANERTGIGAFTEKSCVAAGVTLPHGG